VHHQIQRVRTRDEVAADGGERINASRLARKLSQVAVARRAGIAASYLSRIESGNVHPTLGTALRIASAPIWGLLPAVGS
jgi:transcriptional regulator with XRE-family HTH domain